MTKKAKHPRSSVQVLNNTNHRINMNELKSMPRMSGNLILLFKNAFIIFV